jgi:hypothetical protein
MRKVESGKGQVSNPAQVLLVHGLAESSFWMLPISLALKTAGYNTQFFDYPSTRFSVEQLTEEYLGKPYILFAMRKLFTL